MTGPPLRMVDLHVHTIFSSFRHLKALRARDSYNDPLRVSLLSYFGTSGLSKMVCRSLRRSDQERHTLLLSNYR